MTRQCAFVFCDGEIPGHKIGSARYCCDACRVAAYRRRKRIRQIQQWRLERYGDRRNTKIREKGGGG